MTTQQAPKEPSADGEAALAGYRVLDLADDKGLYCGKLLADLGADVIKVEPPGGDRTRLVPPFYHDEMHPEKSLSFLYLNANKRSLTLDLAGSEGKAAFQRLVATADVVLETFTPGYLDGLGLGYKGLRDINPRLIMTSITGFGQTGPYRHFQSCDIVAQAMGGLMYVTGYAEDPPNLIGARQAYYLASIHAALGTLVALYYRERTGVAQQVDVSLQESCAAAFQPGIIYWDLRRELRQRGDDVHRAGQGIHRCRDGYVAFHAGPRNWPELLKLLDEEGLDHDLHDEQWESQEARSAGRQHIDAICAEYCRRLTVEEVCERSQRNRLFSFPVFDAQQLSDDSQLRSRDFFVKIERSDLPEPITCAGAPYRLSATPWRIRRQPPLIGEHDEEIMAELDAPQPRRPSSPQGSKAKEIGPALPLEGVRILDFSWFGVGPIATKIMADHGAEVIRVESEARLDSLRSAAPFPPDKQGDINASGYFNAFNSSKLDITLDLNEQESWNIVMRLAAISDVVTENFVPDVMKRRGLGYSEMCKVNPEIILASMPAVGLAGPRSHYGGLGSGIKAIAGLSALTGFPDRPPIGPAGSYPDFVINSGHAAIAIMAALLHRQRTGRGQLVELPQYESTVAVTDTSIPEYSANGRVPGPIANRSPEAAPHAAYRCRASVREGEDDCWCVIAVFTEEQWRAFCRAVGNPPWTARPEFATLVDRLAHQDELDRLVTEWTRVRTAEEVMHFLQGAYVPAGVVQTNEDLLDRDPHLRARGYYVYLDHLEVGRSAYDGAPFKLSATPGGPRRAAPLLGQDNQHVLKNILGLAEEEINRLAVAGVIR